MANKRIINLSETAAVESGDYVAVDSASRGTKKYDLSEITTLIASLTNNLVDITVSGTTLVINTGLTNGNEVEY